MLVSLADVNEVYKVSPPGSYGKKNGTTAPSNMCIKFLLARTLWFLASVMRDLAQTWLWVVWGVAGGCGWSVASRVLAAVRGVAGGCGPVWGVANGCGRSAGLPVVAGRCGWLRVVWCVAGGCGWSGCQAGAGSLVLAGWVLLSCALLKCRPVEAKSLEQRINRTVQTWAQASAQSTISLQ